MIGRLMSRVLILPIRAYQLVISPHIGGCCRFEPSCSNYAIEALQRHGPLRGGWLALKRLFRCHPFGASGSDPVPREREGGGMRVGTCKEKLIS